MIGNILTLRENLCIKRLTTLAHLMCILYDSYLVGVFLFNCFMGLTVNEILIKNYNYFYFYFRKVFMLFVKFSINIFKYLTFCFPVQQIISKVYNIRLQRKKEKYLQF